MKEGLQEREKLTTDRLSRVLEERGLKIHQGSEEAFSTMIREQDFAGISPVGQKVLNDLIVGAREYLKGVIIEDPFGDSLQGRRARADLWNELAKQYGPEVTALQKKDKLRMGSSVGILRGYFDWLVTELNTSGIRNESANKVRELYEELLHAIPHSIQKDDAGLQYMNISDYAALTFEEKKAVSQKIDDILRRFLRLVTA